MALHAGYRSRLRAAVLFRRRYPCTRTARRVMSRHCREPTNFGRSPYAIAGTKAGMHVCVRWWPCEFTKRESVLSAWFLRSERAPLNPRAKKGGALTSFGYSRSPPVSALGLQLSNGVVMSCEPDRDTSRQITVPTGRRWSQAMGAPIAVVPFGSLRGTIGNLRRGANYDMTLAVADLRSCLARICEMRFWRVHGGICVSQC